MLAESPRFLEVLRLLKEKSGYGKALPAGQAMGIAAARTFNSIAAHAVIVSKKGSGFSDWLNGTVRSDESRNTAETY